MCLCCVTPAVLRITQKLNQGTPEMTADDELLLSVDAFIRSIAVNKGTPLALFLGAGASVSSGVPSAEDCINEWKREFVLSKNPKLGDQFRQLTVPSVPERIQKWLDQQGG